MSFSYLTGEVENIGISKVKKRAIGGNIIVNCTFNAPDGTALSSYLWIDPADIRPGMAQWSAANWKTISNKAYESNGWNDTIVTINSGVANCTLSCNFNASFWMGFVARVQNSSNCWWFNLDNGTTPTIYEMTSNILTIRATGAVGAYSGIHTVVLSGSVMTWKFAGNTIVSYTSSQHAGNGIHGMLVSTAHGQRFDDFMVTVP